MDLSTSVPRESGIPIGQCQGGRYKGQNRVGPKLRPKRAALGGTLRAILKASRMSYIINNYVNLLYENYKILGKNDYSLT